MNEISVEIWTDVVCPWCFIGKRRFEKALDLSGLREAVRVRWRSFELDPAAPRVTDETIPERMLRRQGIPPRQAARLLAGVSAQAADEGLDYDLALARPSNTFDAHRLVHHAESLGLAGRLQERLMVAYTKEGASLSDHPTLLALAGEAGLEADPVRAVLAGDAYADAVRADEERATRFGVSAVPSFVVAGRWTASGAQTADVLADLLRKAHAATTAP
ncbi:DsbA family oxidoreductase [Streptomyces avicenniae]|uniref:DsbA family oxidoreductase n=1 Tax=Streptomyces avicenniae TaxID=500153 RepID=UPI00069BD2CF|nr:DsbA family oxidoreductase [Streptomyces avicenniae]